MAARRFIDTNVLLYSISRDCGEETKRDRAVGLLAEDDLPLSTQVLQEFYVRAGDFARDRDCGAGHPAGTVSPIGIAPSLRQPRRWGVASCCRTT